MGSSRRLTDQERRQIVRIELQHTLVGVDRAVHVADLALVDGTDLIEDELLLLRVVDQIDLLRVDPEQVLPPRLAAVVVDQRVDAPHVLATQLEDLQDDGDRISRRLGGGETEDSLSRGIPDRYQAIDPGKDDGIGRLFEQHGRGSGVHRFRLL